MAPTAVTFKLRTENFRRSLLRWYREHGRDLPWRRTQDPYAILVSEIMLQQTQVATVIGYYERWLERFPTINSLAAATESDVLHCWQGLGYYSRARNLHAAAKRVVREYGGVLPRDSERLQTLPGMGRYTANAVATFAFDQPLPIVEANITRAISRLFNIRESVDSTSGRHQLWAAATTLVPTQHAADFNSALMDLGALVCRKTPQCSVCPVRVFCRAPDPENLPVKKPRPAVKCLTESHSLTIQTGRILLEQCTNRWRGMWMLPSVQPNEPETRQAIHSSVFPFTNHRITLQVFRVGRRENHGKRSACPATAATRSRISAVMEQSGDPASLTSFLSLRERRTHQRQLRVPSIAPETKRKTVGWFSIEQLDTIPIPSPHRRAISELLQLDVGR